MQGEHVIFLGPSFDTVVELLALCSFSQEDGLNLFDAVFSSINLSLMNLSDSSLLTKTASGLYFPQRVYV